MKKHFLVLLALVLSLSINAQEAVDSYYSSYLKEDYEILASTDNGVLKIYLNVGGEYESDNVIFMMEDKKINEFINSLKQVKIKYQEWSETAKNNNITEMDKEFDIDFPRVDVAWFSSDWWFSFNSILNPYFKVTSSGKCLVVFTNKVTSSSNKYIDKKYYLVFSNAKEIDELTNKINPASLKEKLNKKQNVQDLFH